MSYIIYAVIIHKLKKLISKSYFGLGNILKYGLFNSNSRISLHTCKVVAFRRDQIDRQIDDRQTDKIDT